jgi:hypothetical protein
VSGALLAVILVCLVIAFIPAFIADNKGRSFWGYWFFALAFFVPALIVALLAPPAVDASTLRTCPHCYSQIPRAATVCSQCRHDVPALPRGARAAPPRSVGKLEPVLGMESGSRRCTNPRCDAAGLRTSLERCSVCGDVLVDEPAAPPPPVWSTGGTQGTCNNRACDARGLPTTRQSCEVCGRDITQAFAT